jgi:signal transduction histidine kinase
MTATPDAAARALHCLPEGCSIRSTERLTGLNRNTIMRLLIIAGEGLANEQLESVVQTRTAALRHLSAKLMHSQDEEHRRIARNLHDSLGQYLTSIKMNLEALGRSDTPNKDQVLSAALESVERSIAETRTLSCLLHPPLLDEVGFAATARWYTDEFAKRSGIIVKLHLPDGVDRLPELARIALFRILQESLTNVHRHSGSASVEIQPES